MKFPDLRIKDEELGQTKDVELKLINKINVFFEKEYGINSHVKVSGSTQKGTALPKKYFGTDIDVAIEGTEEIVKKIAYKNDIFEGCPLFTMDFFEKFSKEFQDIYFAGHRLSGKHQGIPFDFAMADILKDKWKWDYNNSKFLDYSKEEVNEAKKFKYFLKTFNLAGSEVNGVVGPALELMIYHHKSLENILSKIKEMPFIENKFSNHFGTVLFPNEYMDLFPHVDNYIHKGLVDSFKYTTPNTYNRLIKCAQNNEIELNSFVSSSKNNFNFFKNLSLGHYKLLAHILGGELKEEDFFDIEVISNKNNTKIYANTNESQKKILEQAVNSIEKIQYNRDIEYNELPETIQNDLKLKTSFDPNQFTYFVGRPSLPLSKHKKYVPFDFLVRSDCEELIKITTGGKYGTQ